MKTTKKLKMINLVLILILIGCQQQDNDCDTLYYEDKLLTEESKQYYLYKDVEQVVFMDADSIEYYYSVNYDHNAMGNYTKSHACGDENQKINFNREEIEVILTHIDQGEHKVKITLRPDFYFEETIFDENHVIDLLRIVESRLSLGSGGIIVIEDYVTSNRGGVVNPVIVNEWFEEIKNFELLGRSFGTVLERLGYFRTLYYSKEIGIVSMYNYNGKLLVFDRIE